MFRGLLSGKKVLTPVVICFFPWFYREVDFFDRQQSSHIYDVKKHFCLFFLLTSSFLLEAQAPLGIPCQAARNASGKAIANTATAVAVRFSVPASISAIQPTALGLGLFSMVNGTFSGIHWGKNAKTRKVEAKIADDEANYGNPSGEKREILKQEPTERFKSEQSTPSNK